MEEVEASQEARICVHKRRTLETPFCRNGKKKRTTRVCLPCHHCPKRPTAEQRETPRRSTSSPSTRPKVPRRFLTTSTRKSKKKSGGDSSSDKGDTSQVIGGSRPSSSRGLNLTPCQERDVVEWFQQHEIFYNKKLRCYKDTAKKGCLLVEKAAELDINGECKFFFFFFVIVSCVVKYYTKKKVLKVI